jgi:hypothetical protein
MVCCLTRNDWMVGALVVWLTKNGWMVGAHGLVADKKWLVGWGPWFGG